MMFLCVVFKSSALIYEMLSIQRYLCAYCALYFPQEYAVVQAQQWIGESRDKIKIIWYRKKSVSDK